MYLLLCKITISNAEEVCKNDKYVKTKMLHWYNMYIKCLAWGYKQN